MQSKVDRDLIAAIRDGSLSLATVALLIARDANPSLRPQAEEERLEVLAAQLTVDSRATTRAQAQTLVAHLCERHGFRGHGQSPCLIQHLYLDQVLRSRVGADVSLAILFASVSQRVGIDAQVVNFPNRCLVRIGGPRGVLVDPFGGGRVLQSEDIANLATRMLGNPERLRPKHLSAAEASEVIEVLLRRLKAAHENAQQHAAAMVICDRLYDLTGDVAIRRDRGMHALALGSSEVAMDDLEAYLSENNRASDVATVRAALMRAREIIEPPS